MTELADSSHLVSKCLWAYVARPCTTALHLNIFCKLYSATIQSWRRISYDDTRTQASDGRVGPSCND